MSISHSPASTAESPCTSPVDAPLLPDPLLPATPTYGEGREVLYNNRHRIRVLPIDGTPFFCVADVADALGWKPAVVLSIAQGPDVPAFMRAIAAEAPDPDILGQPQDQVVVSSAGLFILSHAVDDPVRAQNLVALAKREALQADRVDPTDPRVFLTVLKDEDGQRYLPPYPTRHSGRLREWYTLKNSGPNCFLPWHRPGSIPFDPIAPHRKRNPMTSRPLGSSVGGAR